MLRVRQDFVSIYNFYRIKERRVIFVKQKVGDFHELENDYDVVFNCTGMGSKYLCDDRHMVPIRGQLIKVYKLRRRYQSNHIFFILRYLFFFD